jgi:hypothetical protein
MDALRFVNRTVPPDLEKIGAAFCRDLSSIRSDIVALLEAVRSEGIFRVHFLAYPFVAAGTYLAYVPGQQHLLKTDEATNALLCCRMEMSEMDAMATMRSMFTEPELRMAGQWLSALGTHEGIPPVEQLASLPDEHYFGRVVRLVARL